ncbi:MULTISPECIES: 3'-5' exonuclease [Cobetia]|uniref:3'-5' exonuclease n=1 Tax=Cobetia TaxID=204286 RepID=UPI00158405D8|nr:MULTISPECIES: 3'-5' exonuclease [Cobetia]MDI4659476.1 3'-5' exonuclease [Cobetia sp. BMC6]MDL2192340.1 3'-5' exonuclease [Cobetia sp. LC6]NUJ56024.1 3'-5' exonuclease [Cobetia marina]
MFEQLRRASDRRRHAQGEFAELFRPWHAAERGGERVALDCETTSLDVGHAELVSLAAVRFDARHIHASSALSLYLQCPQGLQGDSIRIHRLRGIDLHGGEALGDALRQLLEFIGNRPLVGWCIDFDVAVINRHLRPRFGFDLPNQRHDLARDYARRCKHEQPDAAPDLRFEAMADALGVPVIGRHSALGDAVTSALMAQRLMQAPLSPSLASQA